MPRARRGAPPSPPPLPDPQGDEWGRDPDPDAEIELPPAPRAVERSSPPPEQVSQLGPPPTDAMAGAAWAYQVALRMAHVAFSDPNISAETREKRVLKLLNGAQKHLTDAARYDVKKLILQQRAELEDRKRHKAAAKLEKRPPPGGAKIIPLRRVEIHDDVERMKDIARRDRDG